VSAEAMSDRPAANEWAALDGRALGYTQVLPESDKPGGEPTAVLKEMHSVEELKDELRKAGAAM